MNTISFYTEYSATALDLIEKVAHCFPCWIHWESVEMNWMEITITARIEDIASIEKIFSKIA